MPKKFKGRYRFISAFALAFFGKLADKYSEHFVDLKQYLIQSDLRILLRTYISLIFLASFFAYFFAVIGMFIIATIFRISLLFTIFLVIVIPIVVAVVTFAFMYFLPISLSIRRRNDIESNLPFAINNMAAIAGSGVPPFTMFKIISQFSEYGEISKEASKIARNIELFGLDEITAIKDVASKTPSPALKDVLEGILTTVQTGGNLKNYLKEEAEKAMFDYRIRRDRYNQNLSVYADLYTALLIAAPLLFIAILSVLSIIGGNVYGIATEDLIRVGVFVLIPLLNIMFLIFLQISQPRI